MGEVGGKKSDVCLLMYFIRSYLQKFCSLLVKQILHEQFLHDNRIDKQLMKLLDVSAGCDLNLNVDFLAGGRG